MLTTFVLIQVGFNVAVIIALIRILRERQATARQACAREDRLEALAAELCAVGRHVAHQNPPVEATARAVTDSIAPLEVSRSEQRIESSAASTRVAGRVRGAATLLERGVAIEQVANETSLLPGEVEVLRNLRRASRPARGEHRTDGVPNPPTLRRLRRASQGGSKCAQV